MALRLVRLLVELLCVFFSLAAMPLVSFSFVFLF